MKLIDKVLDRLVGKAKAEAAIGVNGCWCSPNPALCVGGHARYCSSSSGAVWKGCC